MELYAAMLITYIGTIKFKAFFNPTPTLIAFTGVTNAHGPSPQPTAFRSPSCSKYVCYKNFLMTGFEMLTSGIGSNCSAN